MYDPTVPVGRLLFNVLAMVAVFEADLIRARTREVMRVAKAKGHLRGQQPKLNPRQEAHLAELLALAGYSIGEVADLFGIGRATVYPAVQRTPAATRPVNKPVVLRRGIADRAGSHCAPTNRKRPVRGDRPEPDSQPRHLSSDEYADAG